MGLYNLSPDEIRELQPPDPGELLKRDGSNLASVLANLDVSAPELKERIEEYLAKITPGVAGVEVRSIGPKKTLEFRQDVRGAQAPWRFLASNMSDGTLRALGVLVALFQTNGRTLPRLIGIEEPEIALHPAAAGVLTDALWEASQHTQVLVTSHSPDLLDNDSIPDGAILAVVSEHGESQYRTTGRGGQVGAPRPPVHGRRADAHGPAPTGSRALLPQAARHLQVLVLSFMPRIVTIVEFALGGRSVGRLHGPVGPYAGSCSADFGVDAAWTRARTVAGAAVGTEAD